MGNMRIAALSALLLGACAQNDVSLTINGFIVPTDPPACLAAASATTFQTGGLLDLAIVQGDGIPAIGATRGYFAAPLIVNDLGPLMQGLVEYNAIFVNGFDVQIEPPAELAAALPTSQRKFFVPAAIGRIAPAGMATGFVEILPAQIAIQLATAVQAGQQVNFPTVVVKIRPVGTRTDSTVTGAFVSYPVQLCKYCLVPAPERTGTCPAGGANKTDVLTGGCQLQQDKNTSCCNDAMTGTRLCGAQIPTK